MPGKRRWKCLLGCTTTPASGTLRQTWDRKEELLLPREAFIGIVKLPPAQTLSPHLVDSVDHDSVLRGRALPGVSYSLQPGLEAGLKVVEGSGGRLTSLGGLVSQTPAPTSCLGRLLFLLLLLLPPPAFFSIYKLYPDIDIPAPVPRRKA